MNNGRYCLLIATLAFAVLSACAIAPDGTMRTANGKLIRGTQQEIAAKQATLLMLDRVKPLLKDRGRIVLDGVVLDVKTSETGVLIARVSVEDVLLGSVEGKREIEVLTPSGDTGVAFESGRRYRILTLWIEGGYRTWDFSGTVALDGVE